MTRLEFEVGNSTWYSYFLKGHPFLTPENRLLLNQFAVQMYLDQEERRSLNCSDFEGVLYRKGYGLLVDHGGPVFVAELDTGRGRVEISFLILDPPKDS